MSIGAVLTIIFGLAALLTNPGYYLTQAWMYWKLALVIALLIYHGWCWQHVQAFKLNKNQHSHKWFRWFNEVPILFLFGIAVLVLVKPNL